jgi:DNA modification methylase
VSESFLDGKVTLLRGDCLELLPTLEECSVDSCVTDPPYHLTSIVKRFGKEAESHLSVKADKDLGTILAPAYKRLSKGFMGKQWDGGDIAFRPELWAEVLRVLKPGAHLLAFSGTRTYHRMACAIEDAGFEIRDQIGWCYGSGFPKSHDISKAIDRAAGAERNVVARVAGMGKQNPEWNGTAQGRAKNSFEPEYDLTEPATDSAIQWQGWGTALKPSYEPIVLAQKPYTAQQFLAILVPTIGELICKVVSFAKTDTSLFTSASANGFLSTVTSLSSALEDLSHRGSMCTTETATALIIDLKILNSLLSKITRAITIGELSRINGGEFDVRSAVAISESVLAKCERLQRTTADELVISELAEMANVQAESPISPNWDCIVLARKPLSESSIASNVLKHGTGAINIDGCRIAAEVQTGWGGKAAGGNTWNDENCGLSKDGEARPVNGRWPANLIHDGSEEVVSGFPETVSGDRNGIRKAHDEFGTFKDRERDSGYWKDGDAGSAARFFYTAKADQDDRLGSKHPTVKPLDLIQYLCRLITPSGGTILDCFSGTGTTGEAAYREGFRAILIEREPEYQADIVRRMGLCLAGPDERRAASVKQESIDDLPMFAGRG